MPKGRAWSGGVARKSSALIALLALGLAACGSSGGSQTGSGAQTGGTSQSGGSNGTNTINIGFDAEATGQIAAFGVSFLQGAKVGVDEVNKNGGVTVHGKKYKFKLDVCNDNSDQTQVAACVTKLIKTHNDKFIFGGLADFGPIVRGITEPNHVIYFSTGSAVAALMSKSHYVVNTVASLNARSLMSVRGFKKMFPSAKTVALLGEQDATDRAAFAADKLAFQKEGLKLVGTQIAPLNATDYSSFLTSLKAKHPDVIWNELASSPNSEQQMLQQNATLHAANVVFNNSGSCPSTYPHTPGITYMAETNAGAIDVGPLQSPGIKQYKKVYYSLGGVPNPDPNINAGLFIYDFFGVLAKAIDKAQTFTNTSAVLKAVNSETYHGVSGTITVHNNQSSYGQVICQMQNGNTKLSEFEVFPNGSSTKLSKANAAG